MNLNPTDRKTLEKIRRSEALSKKMRWVSVVVLMVLVVLLIRTGSEMNEFRESILNDEGFTAEIFAFGLPMLYFRLSVLSCVTGILLGLAIKNWNGNKTHQLIVGIVDAIEKEGLNQSAQVNPCNPPQNPRIT